MVHGKNFQCRKYRKITLRERILLIQDAKDWQNPQYRVTVRNVEE